MEWVKRSAEKRAVGGVCRLLSVGCNAHPPLREGEILGRWGLLLELLEKHRLTLSSVSLLMGLLREADTLHAEIRAMEAGFLSDEYGRHLLAVEDLRQKQALDELNLASRGEAIRRLTLQAAPLLGHREGPVLQRRLDELNADFARSGDTRSLAGTPGAFLKES